MDVAHEADVVRGAGTCNAEEGAEGNGKEPCCRHQGRTKLFTNTVRRSTESIAGHIARTSLHLQPTGGTQSPLFVGG